jgi:hypothetical protein
VTPVTGSMALSDNVIELDAPSHMAR